MSMRFIVAPDSYKGSVSALNVARAMEKGIQRAFPSANVHKMPIADGGEGTVEALVSATSGEMRYCTVKGPLGTPIQAFWGILGDKKTAVIEMAAASGLPLVPSGSRDPCITTTYGTGELIRAALDAGLQHIIIGIGGSATNDGGTGMARALGARFLDDAGEPLPEGGAALQKLKTIDLSNFDARLSTVSLTVACDVDNPLCGPRGASSVFGPQKGATPAMVALLDKALEHFADIATQTTGRDVAHAAGAGAAGGLGAGLLFFTPAKLRPGVEIVLEAVDFETHIKNTDWVFTGEGRTDFQTAFGKAPVGVAKLAKQFNVPVFCLSGGLGEGADDVLSQGIDALMSICNKPMSLEECMRDGEKLIEAACYHICQMIKAALTHKTLS